MKQLRPKQLCKEVSSRVFKLFFIILLMLHQSDFALMQSVAWLGMLSQNSVEVSSIQKAIEKTFDGQNPCELCHFIQESQSHDDSESMPETVKKKKPETQFSLESSIQLKKTKPFIEGLSGLSFMRQSNLESQCAFEVALPPPKV